MVDATLTEDAPPTGEPPPPPPDELFLIDGNSLVYRAFFALPESIATSQGFPTNAIFGFASMLVKILTDHGVKPTLVVWDAGSSGRKEVYEEYKGHRPEQPDLLSQQYPHMRPLVEAFGYENVSVPGYEADDVIASLTEQAKALGIPVTIVTGDRDAFQLVDDGVRVMATSRGITETRMYERRDVEERYGIPPELIPDFYGLKGDTSDNIPGVPGIGDKTAAQLLQRFGSLEGVLEHVDEISGAKRQQNLREHAEAARISKVLATARRDIPVDLDLREEVARTPDRSRLRQAFHEFELRDPLRRLEEALGEAEAAPPPAAAVSVDAPAREGRLDEVAALPGDTLALAAVREEPPEDQLFAEEDPGWRWAAWGGEGPVLTGRCADAAELSAAAGDRPVVAHDAKALGRVPARLEHDTEIAAYLLDPAGRAYPLDELCDRRAIGTAQEDPVAARALLTHALAAAQRDDLRERGQERLLHEVELPCVAVLRSMELAGLKLDTERLRAIRDRVLDEMHDLEREVWELAGEEFHLGSPQQLAEVLFERLGLSRKKRGKTGFSTDASVLRAIRHEHPIVEKVERHRELSKLVSTYLEAMPEHQAQAPDHRIHTTFHQTATTTGRLSSTDPNLQNIPIRTELGREIRACFVAEPGNLLISADYSQVELRILAAVAGEEVLKEIFRRGEDVHTATARQVLGVDGEPDPAARSKAKMVNYGIVYGLSGYGLAERLQIPQDEAQGFIDAYLERFPAVRTFITETITKATNDGYVATILGRRRQVPELRARQRQVRQLGERLAVNAVIQGSAADVIKVAMVRCHHALAEAGLRTRLILQIHDELLFEGPAEEAERARPIIEREMVGAADIDPPLEVDAGVGPNWLEAK
jgi:DNA polymerase-1